ncbi:hypothetical protein KY290_017896 [Solanum tuberosum]|uniref:very-long-chain 3-oxoacyl-CoA synthase n=1 Tax=Solanum tuberosum TaxID=4113 RepID=A0ABQ7VCL5_SOLTU|nr:hypothetical protein KY285_016858 [Solanum tuberosum]KAH0761823.1 hypothetical protein KY290_017896 [Solanum tuberosum]
MDKQSITFMTKILNQSGQSDETYIPPALHYIPPKSDYQEVISEVHMVLFPVFEDLLAKTKLTPRDIDVLIVNCSGFCPAPSLSSIIVNKFRMREDIKSYTISGMGCSASALAIDITQNIFKSLKDSIAVVLSTEILSTESKNRAKYELVKTLRTQRAYDDKGYFSAYREEDSDGYTGVTLKRNLLETAGETLRSNITILGRAVINEIGQGLNLGESDMEAALMTLHRFGNQSSSSLWYELAYLEAKERVKRGDKVWMLGMGSGPKCISIIWECIRPICGEAQRGPWADSIDGYPLG